MHFSFQPSWPRPARLKQAPPPPPLPSAAKMAAGGEEPSQQLGNNISPGNVGKDLQVTYTAASFVLLLLLLLLLLHLLLLVRHSGSRNPESADGKRKKISPKNFQPLRIALEKSASRCFKMFLQDSSEFIGIPSIRGSNDPEVSCGVFLIKLNRFPCSILRRGQLS